MLPYLDPNGFIQDRAEKGRFSGNGPLRTAEACIVLGEAGELTAQFKSLFLVAQSLTWMNGIGFAREPTLWRDSQDSVDNLVGHLIIATWCGSADAIRMWLERGRKGFKLPQWWLPKFLTRYYFPNEPQYQSKYGWRPHFFKFYAARCAAQWTVGEPTSRWLEFWWVFTIATTGMWGKQGQDPYILSDLLIAHARRLGKAPKGSWSEWACERAEKTRDKSYPGGRAEVSAWYFRPSDSSPPNWSHWLVQAYKLLAEKRETK